MGGEYALNPRHSAFLPFFRAILNDPAKFLRKNMFATTFQNL